MAAYHFEQIPSPLIPAPIFLSIIRTILTRLNYRQENCVSNEQTRRTFLKLSALGLTASTSSRFSLASPAPQAGEIAVRVTAGNLRYAAAPALSWHTGEATGDNVLTLDPS